MLSTSTELRPNKSICVHKNNMSTLQSFVFSQLIAHDQSKN